MNFNYVEKVLETGEDLEDFFSRVRKPRWRSDAPWQALFDETPAGVRCLAMRQMTEPDPPWLHPSDQPTWATQYLWLGTTGYLDPEDFPDISSLRAMFPGSVRPDVTTLIDSQYKHTYRFDFVVEQDHREFNEAELLDYPRRLREAAQRWLDKQLKTVSPTELDPLLDR